MPLHKRPLWPKDDGLDWDVVIPETLSGLTFSVPTMNIFWFGKHHLLIIVFQPPDVHREETWSWRYNLRSPNPEENPQAGPLTIAERPESDFLWLKGTLNGVESGGEPPDLRFSVHLSNVQFLM